MKRGRLATASGSVAMPTRWDTFTTKRWVSDTGVALSHKGFMDWNLLVLEMV
jgi:hypothetical protein